MGKWEHMLYFQSTKLQHYKNVYVMIKPRQELQQ